MAPLFLLAVTAALYPQEATINGVADDLAKALSVGPPKRVAVVDFTDLNSTVTQLGKYFAQELEIDLAKSTIRIDLVNRSRLSELMKENKLDATGLIDPDTARKLGKIAGVEVLIVGTVTPLDETVRLDVEAIDTEDARVLAATSRNILKTRDILALLGQTPSAPEPGDATGAFAQQPTAPQTQPKAAQFFESHDIQFALNSCSREAASIVCGLAITNKSNDTQIWLHNHCGAPARIIDGIGREFKASEVILGSTRDDNCQVEGTLVNNVPTRTEIRFNNIPPDVSSISLFDLPTNLVNNVFVDVAFHKIPLVQQRF